MRSLADPTRAIWAAMGAVALCALTTVVAPRPAQAAMAQLTTDQLVDASDLVVRGTVNEVWTELDPRGKVWTRAQVTVTEVLKGELDETALIVDEPGGVWGDHTTMAWSVARFSVGEDTLLFLEKHDDGRFEPVGLVQGKFTVRLDPYTRTEIVQRYSVPINRKYDHRFIPLPDPARRISLDEMKQQILDRVSAGWDGKPIPGTSLERLRRINDATRGEK